MELMSNKIEDGGATPEGKFPAAETNQFTKELENAITQTGQTLTNADLNQVGKSMASYASNGTTYIDSGVVNAYVLTRVGSVQSVDVLPDILGAEFYPNNDNTGPCTANVAGLGVKSIKLRGGADPAAGQVTGRTILSFDLGNDWHELVQVNGNNLVGDLDIDGNGVINGNLDVVGGNLDVDGNGTINGELLDIDNSTSADRTSVTIRTQDGGVSLSVLSDEVQLRHITSGGVLGDLILRAFDNGKTTLYENGGQRFETDPDGAGVFGNLTITDTPSADTDAITKGYFEGVQEDTNGIGARLKLLNDSVGSIASNASIAGSLLRNIVTDPSSNAFNQGASKTGTWKNITGMTVPDLYEGTFVRTA